MKFAAEFLEHDLRRVAVVARLVGPLARLDLTFDINLRALAQITLGDAAEVFVEDDDIVPLGPLLAVAVAVLPLLGGGDAHVDHFAAVVERARLRVRAQIADQNDLVHARHVALSSWWRVAINRARPPSSRSGRRTHRQAGISS